MFNLRLGQRSFSTATSVLQQTAKSTAAASSSGSGFPKTWHKRTSSPKRPANDALSKSVQAMEANAKRKDEKEIHASFIRKFNAGSTYDPFDFSMTKLRLERRAHAEQVKEDRFKKAKFDPLKLWKEPLELSQFITSNGQILPGYKNGHRKKTQRRLAKAIRRARAAGLLSHTHQDVSLLQTDRK